jgi:uncharacterized protein YbgA (DUF1722 family)/uncharacterized protein YbbK (DUF523 family)
MAGDDLPSDDLGPDDAPPVPPSPAEDPAHGAPKPLVLGVSSCLLGENVRSNGGHARDDFVVKGLGPYVRFVPVCPEAEVGMGTPREVVRLVGTAEAPRMLGTKTGTEWTERMNAFASERAESLAGEDLDGFVFKKSSPSCGLFRVKLYDKNGVPTYAARGLWAATMARRHPLLPMEEDGRLNDPRLRENFVERLFVHRRWKDCLARRTGIKDLVAFHASVKLTLLAHSPTAYRELGRLVAQAEPLPLPELEARYGAGLMAAMAVLTTPGRHANVMEHVLGFLKDHLDAHDRSELKELIHDHRRGLVPLIVPLTLLHHHLRRAPVAPWIRAQSYLDPYPRELLLRNSL